jgi:hypothetical protein
LTPGFEIIGDERQHMVKNYHIPTLKRNISTNIVRDGNELRCVTCNIPHNFTGTEPVCVILTDQNFPPALPTNSDNSCCVVLRLEDCFLSELPGLLKEFFGNQPRFLPEGSILMFGSLSHLTKRGLESYAEECVKTQKIFTSMIPNTCSVTHVVFVPLGGMDSAGLIRDLYDLDCWLRRATGTSVPSLPAARAKLWEILCGSGSGSGKHSDRTIFLPESITSSTKIRTISERPPTVVPESVDKLSEPDEKEIISAICREVNESFALNIDKNPILDRCSEASASKHKNGNSRIVAIGGSHISRVVGGLVSLNCEIINLSRPGWVADPDSIAECANKLRSYKLSDQDSLLIDPLSNSVFCRTDEHGNQADPVKIDGNWHIVGELSVRPKTVLKNILNLCMEMIGKVSPHIICLAPVPRYIFTKWCNDLSHVKNYTEPDYISDIEAGLEMTEDLVTGWTQNCTTRADIINFRSAADEPEQSLPELLTDGGPIWSEDDPVHCVPSVYVALANQIASALTSDDEVTASEPHAKRQRLESVVVQRIGAVNVTAPRRSTASWSTGSLPPTWGRGSRARGASFRGRSSRGRQRGWFRPFRGGRGRY